MKKILNVLLVLSLLVGFAGMADAARTKPGIITFYSGLTGGATGALDAQTAPGGNWVDGDQAYGTVSGVFYVYQMDTDNAGTESTVAPWSIIDPDNETSDERWVLVKTYGGDFTFVQAGRNAVQTISPATFTTIVYNYEYEDVLNEFDTSTGIFTAKHAGVYNVSVYGLFDNASWTTPQHIRVTVTRSVTSPTSFYIARTVLPTSTFYAPFNGSASVKLAAGETLQIRLEQNNASSRNLLASSSENVLIISREY